MHDPLQRLPDWPALMAVFNHWLLLAIKTLIGAFSLIIPSLVDVEVILTRIPIWTNALTAVLGLLFLLIKHWQQMSEWNQRRRSRRQARRLRM